MVRIGWSACALFLLINVRRVHWRFFFFHLFACPRMQLLLFLSLLNQRATRHVSVTSLHLSTFTRRADVSQPSIFLSFQNHFE